jgi:hypothetical protein
MLQLATTIHLQSSTMVNAYFQAATMIQHAITTLPQAVMMEHAPTPVAPTQPPATTMSLLAATMARAHL